MIENLQPIIQLDEEGQAVYFHARERRRSLAGVVELFRTNFIPDIPTANISGASFPDEVRSSVVTFTTAIRTHPVMEELTIVNLNAAGSGYQVGDLVGITETGADVKTHAVIEVLTVDGGNGIATFAVNDPGGYPTPPTTLVGNAATGGTGSGATFDLTFSTVTYDPEGLIFELGSSTSGIAAWIENGAIGFTAGNGAVTTVDAATGTFLFAGGIPNDLELDLVFSVRPGDGRIRVWANGQEIINVIASSEFLLNGEWSDSGDGSFAAAPDGTVNLNVPAASRVAPNSFDVIAPLSGYAKQMPRQFVFEKV